jgi:hypothetical protein
MKRILLAGVVCALSFTAARAQYYGDDYDTRMRALQDEQQRQQFEMERYKRKMEERLQEMEARHQQEDFYRDQMNRNFMYYMGR